MRAIHVDFASRSFEWVIAAMRPVHWLLVGIGLVMCAGGIVALHDLTARQVKFEQAQFRALARSAPVASVRKSPVTEEQANAVNSAIQQLNLPWGRILTAIERATPTSIALLELEPDAKKHLVRGMAETKTAASMLEYITRLKQQPFMGNVILTKHEIDDQDANRPLRFEFEVEWLEGTAQ